MLIQQLITVQHVWLIRSLLLNVHPSHDHFKIIGLTLMVTLVNLKVS